MKDKSRLRTFITRIAKSSRKVLGLETSEEVILRLDDGEVQILSRIEVLRKAQDLVREHVKGRRSLVKELREERHREAKLK